MSILVPLVAAPVVVVLAAQVSVVEAVMVFAVAVVIPHIRTIDVKPLVWALAVVAFFVPDRYEIAAGLPIDLEPYRIVFAVICLVWLVALLTNPSSRFRRSMLDIPLIAILASFMLSIVANPERANRFDQSIIKALVLFATYILMVYLISSVFPTLEDTRRFIGIVVGLGSVVAVFAVVESVTGYNIFEEWLRVGWLREIPLANLGEATRGEVTRAHASASHPIALGVMLAMLFPLATYLAHRDRRWLISAMLLLSGIVATVSRTPLVMLVVIMIVVALFRPAESLRVVGATAFAGLAIFVASPSLLTSVGESFFPSGGLLSEQSNTATGNVESRGRLADLAPVVRDWMNEPLVGQGFGSRPVDGREDSLGDGRYSGVLDDQWLDLLLETGVVGVAVWIGLFYTLIRALLKRARIPDDTGFLCVALLASVVGFAVAMLFLDAFSFPQLIFVAFVIISIAANVARQSRIADPLPGGVATTR